MTLEKHFILESKGTHYWKIAAELFATKSSAKNFRQRFAQYNVCRCACFALILPDRLKFASCGPGCDCDWCGTVVQVVARKPTLFVKFLALSETATKLTLKDIMLLWLKNCSSSINEQAEILVCSWFKFFLKNQQKAHKRGGGKIWVNKKKKQQKGSSHIQ